MDGRMAAAKALVAEMRRTMGFMKKGPYRLADTTVRIIRGTYTLNDLAALAKELGCSIPHLVTGCRARYDGTLSPSEAVEASIRHAGWTMEDAAETAGYPDQRHFLKCLRNGTIAVKALISIALAIGVPMEELLSDSECVMTRWEDCIPDEITRTREQVIMGWL